MKKFFDKIKNKANSLAVSAKTTLANAKAEGYIDTGVNIIIGVDETDYEKAVKAIYDEFIK